MDWIIPLIIVLPITYFVLIVAHYMVLYFIVWMGWDQSDWFESLNRKENNEK